MPADFPQDVADKLDAASDITSTATGWANRIISLLAELAGAANVFGTSATVDAATAGDAADKVLVADSLGRLPAANLTNPIPAANLPTGEDEGDVPLLGPGGLLPAAVVPLGSGFNFDNIGAPVTVLSGNFTWQIPANLVAAIVCCVGNGSANANFFGSGHPYMSQDDLPPPNRTDFVMRRRVGTGTVREDYFSEQFVITFYGTPGEVSWGFFPRALLSEAGGNTVFCRPGQFTRLITARGGGLVLDSGRNQTGARFIGINNPADGWGHAPDGPAITIIWPIT